MKIHNKKYTILMITALLPSELISSSSVSQTTVPVLWKGKHFFFALIRKPLCNICLLPYTNHLIKIILCPTLACVEALPISFVISGAFNWHMTPHIQTATSHLTMKNVSSAARNFAFCLLKVCQ
jgi:hypothetical protein